MNSGETYSKDIIAIEMSRHLSYVRMYIVFNMHIMHIFIIPTYFSNIIEI